MREVINGRKDKVVAVRMVEFGTHHEMLVFGDERAKLWQYQ
jgi:hypothetical protein